MASIGGAFATTTRLSIPNRTTALSHLPKSRPSLLSIPTRNRQSPSFLSLPSPRPTRSTSPAAAVEEAPAVLYEAPEPVEVQLVASAAADGPKGEDVFAVVMIGSRQYIVIPGRYIYTQRLKGANVNDKIILNKVLLVGTRTKAYIGEPVVTNAAVHAVVEEQGLDKKVIVFKFKKKKNYRRTIGHRQPNTRIRITGITGYEDFPAETMPEEGQ